MAKEQSNSQYDFKQWYIPEEPDPTIAVGVVGQNGNTVIGGADSPVAVEGQGVNFALEGYLRSGMRDYNNGKGWWIGVKNGIPVFSMGDSSGSSIVYNGSTLTITGGGIAVSSLDIPDTTTANSFHTDINGNSWWGANVASGSSVANASITSAGLITAKNILIGGATIQYQVVNGGMQSFGDGSDGAGVADGVTALAGATLGGSTYTLTRDVYYTDLIISTGVSIVPAGYRIFGTGTLTENGTGKIFRDGNAGGDANGGIQGTAAAAIADGYLKGSVAGQIGAAQSAGVGSNGTGGLSTSNSIGSNGSAGGNGGAGVAGAGGTGGGGGTATASNVKLIANWHLATLLDVGSTGSTVKFDNSAGAGSGGSGGGGTGASAAGGGSGSPGAIVAIYFRVIVIGASASITANGGKGGNGGNSSNLNGGGGGGGGGGNGGQIILVYNSLTNSGTLTASGGAGGSLGTGNGTGANGTAGAAGSAGTVRQFQISL